MLLAAFAPKTDRPIGAIHEGILRMQDTSSRGLRDEVYSRVHGKQHTPIRCGPMTVSRSRRSAQEIP